MWSSEKKNLPLPIRDLPHLPKSVSTARDTWLVNLGNPPCQEFSNLHPSTCAKNCRFFEGGVFDHEKSFSISWVDWRFRKVWLYVEKQLHSADSSVDSNWTSWLGSWTGVRGKEREGDGGFFSFWGQSLQNDLSLTNVQGLRLSSLYLLRRRGKEVKVNAYSWLQIEN